MLAFPLNSDIEHFAGAVSMAVKGPALELRVEDDKKSPSIQATLVGSC